MLKLYFNGLVNSLKIAYSIILVVTCIYNYWNAQYIVCLMVKCKDSISTVVKSMFPRSLALVCLISRITVFFKSYSDFPTYATKVKEYDLNFPIDRSTRKFHRLFTAFVKLAYVLIILPLNVFRMYLIYKNFHDNEILFFFINMYSHNWSICLTEIQFIDKCFGLYQKFQSINEDMATVKSDVINANNYPDVLRAEPNVRSQTRNSGLAASNRDAHLNLPKIMVQHLMVNKIEMFRMRHRFVRRILSALNHLYGIQLGLSICILFTLVLFDIYGEKYTTNNKTRSKILIYGWLLQYSFRFCVIVLTTHVTTKEVL